MNIIKLTYSAAIILCILCFKLTVYASGSAGVSGAAFLDLGIGARALGMGEAYTAATGDVNSLYYNPAGLGTLNFPILSIQHQELIADSKFENITCAFPVYNGFLAISNSLFWVPPFDRIDMYGNAISKITFINGAFTVGYGANLGFMYVGGSVKYIYQKIDSLYINSAAVDLGIMKGLSFHTPFEAPVQNFFIGLSILNLGTPAHNSPLPRRLNLGFSYKFAHWACLNMDLSQSMIDVSDFYDFTYGFDESFRVKFGVEFNYLDIIFVRGGYKINDGGTYSVGMGFNYAVQNVAMVLDTSYEDVGIFGPNYSINLSFKLIPKVITYEDRVAAQSHFRNGIRFFVGDELDAAIREFRLARDYDPYIENINRRIRELEELRRITEENRRFEIMRRN